MASVDDYIGKEFGSFVIEDLIGSGAQAVVFRVEDRKFGRRLVLRLDRKDASLWSLDPVIPPRNGSIELRNVKGSWNAAREYSRVHFSDKIKVVVNVPTVYGVLDSYWLVPFSNPFRVPSALDVDQVLVAADHQAFSDSPLWRALASQLVSDTASRLSGKITDREWEQHWSLFVSEPRIHPAALQAVIAQGYADRFDGFEKLFEHYFDEDLPPFFHNILLRLALARIGCTISDQQLLATLRCRHFRLNVAVWMAEQFIAVYGLSEYVAAHRNDISAECVKIMDAMVHELTVQPVVEWESKDEVEERERQRPYDDYDLFFQDLAGGSQAFPILTK
jgi:hypothetical protein